MLRMNEGPPLSKGCAPEFLAQVLVMPWYGRVQGRPAKQDPRLLKDRYESKSESEEEFNDAGAEITGRKTPTTSNPWRRSGGSTSKRRRYEEECVTRAGNDPAGRSGDHPHDKRDGRRSPVVCYVSDASKGSADEEICDTDSDSGDVPSNGALRRVGGKSETAGGGRTDPVRSLTSGSRFRAGEVVGDGGDSMARSVSKKTVLSKPSVSESAADKKRDADGGAGEDVRERGDVGVRRTVDSSSKHKTRRNIPARADENGWITKAKATDPVSAFKGSQSAARKNKERNLKQKTLAFRPIGAVGRRNRHGDASDEEIEEVS